MTYLKGVIGVTENESGETDERNVYRFLNYNALPKLL